MKKALLIMALVFSGFVYGQVSEIKLNPEKVEKFSPYVAIRHGGADGFEKWKAVNRLQYAKEMWYYSESFYVKRNHLSEGTILNEEIIDISRFEASRKDNEEAIVILPGFKDVLILVPANSLIYKP